MGKHATWMPLYVSDYWGATAHLTALESGGYLHLLMQAWTRGGSLHDDDAVLARLARCTPEEWSAIAPAVRAMFAAKRGFLTHPRLTLELRAAEAKYRTRLKQTEKATIAAAAQRKQKQQDASVTDSVTTHTTTTTTTKDQKQGQKQGHAEAAPPLPSWVPQPAMATFIAYRKAARKPLTSAGLTLAIRKLDALRQQGHDPTAVLEQSVERGWSGLFPVKGDSTSINRNDRRDDVTASILGVFGHGQATADDTETDITAEARRIA
jgi:uncharacterized protein YdaU (DUF1376 family)